MGKKGGEKMSELLTSIKIGEEITSNDVETDNIEENSKQEIKDLGRVVKNEWISLREDQRTPLYEKIELVMGKCENEECEMAGVEHALNDYKNIAKILTPEHRQHIEELEENNEALIGPCFCCKETSNRVLTEEENIGYLNSLGLK